MREKLLALSGSRRFWTAAITAVVVLGNERFGINISEDKLALFVTVAVGWIVGDSINKTE